MLAHWGWGVPTSIPTTTECMTWSLPVKPAYPSAKLSHFQRALEAPIPSPQAWYLKEEAKHQGQCPKAETGAYLLSVDALVRVQTLLLLHLLQLWAQGENIKGFGVQHRERSLPELSGHDPTAVPYHLQVEVPHPIPLHA